MSDALNLIEEATARRRQAESAAEFWNDIALRLAYVMAQGKPMKNGSITVPKKLPKKDAGTELELKALARTIKVTVKVKPLDDR